MQRQLTEIIQSWHQGDDQAKQDLYQFAYLQLRTLAKKERAKVEAKYKNENLLINDEVFNTTSLIHDAYLKLEQADTSYIENRRQFYLMMSKVMRQVMFEAARKNGAQKRQQPTGSANDEHDEDCSHSRALLKTLESFSDKYPRQAEVVQLKYFMGFDNEKISHILQASQSLVEKDAKFAKAWLQVNLA